MNLTSLYRFELPNTCLTPMFLLKPLGKAGNNQLFNEFFSTPNLISSKVIGPIPEIDGEYQVCKVEFLTAEGKTHTMVFQRNFELLGDYGIVGVNDYHKDCYLYKTIAPNTIEVYISNGNGKLTPHLLMMLCDGSLDAEIELLRNKFLSI